MPDPARYPARLSLWRAPAAPARLQRAPPRRSSPGSVPGWSRSPRPPPALAARAGPPLRLSRAQPSCLVCRGSAGELGLRRFAAEDEDLERLRRRLALRFEDHDHLDPVRAV